MGRPAAAIAAVVYPGWGEGARGVGRAATAVETEAVALVPSLEATEVDRAAMGAEAEEVALGTPEGRAPLTSSPRPGKISLVWEPEPGLTSMLSVSFIVSTVSPSKWTLVRSKFTSFIAPLYISWRVQSSVISIFGALGWLGT